MSNDTRSYTIIADAPIRVRVDTTDPDAEGPVEEFTVDPEEILELTVETVIECRLGSKV